MSARPSVEPGTAPTAPSTPASLLTRLGPPLLLVALATLPLVGAIGHADRLVGDPLGELPVKVWVFETFARIGLLGGRVDTAGFPNLGPLNNPDPAGTLVTGLLRPLVGRVWAYNLLVSGQLAASMLAAWALARALVGDALAALVAGVTFGLAPLVLAYAVSGAITDILNLWPYPLALLGLLNALRAASPRATAAWGAFGGAVAGLGFVTCPYNFVVFGAMAFPAATLVPFARRDGLVPAGPPLTPTLRTAALALLSLLAALLLVAGTHALYIRGILADPTSQMSASAVSATRHAPPYRFLEPGHRDRYVAWLADYVAVGKGALVERVAAARFYRAFAPGFLAYALALAGLLAPRRRATLVWAGTALFCVLASTGPFLPLTRDVFLPGPYNPAWLLTQHVLPGGDLILEPFRYALPASLALGICAAVGARELGRRVHRRILPAVAVVVAMEVALVSPAPFPVPTTRLAAPAVYRELDALLPPGAVIELPYFDHASDRFYREHFFHQLLHGRPIPNEVIGFAPRYLRDNQFTAKLLSIEKDTGRLRVEVTDPGRIAADRDRLASDGFAGIVVDPTGFATEAAREGVAAELAPFGPPVRQGDRWVYRIPPPTP